MCINCTAFSYMVNIYKKLISIMDYQSPVQQILRSRLFFVIEIVVSTIIGIFLVFPILGSLLALNEFLRLVSRLALWVFYGDRYKLPIDAVGVNYVQMTKENPRTVLYLGEVEATLDVQEIRNNYQKHVIENENYEVLKYIWDRKWLYTCLKKCDNFDIANHVRYYPGTEDTIVKEKELIGKILPDLSLDMEDLSKPQWEEVIIPRYQSENQIKSLRIIRINHGYMDGASMLLMIVNTFANEKSFPFVIDPTKPLKISWISMFLYKLTCAALFASHMLKHLAMPPCTKASRFTVVNPTYPRKPLFTWTKRIPMKYFQNIKEKTGVSMPGIVTAVLAGAFRSLDSNYPTKENVKKGITLAPDSSPISIVAGRFPCPKYKPGNYHAIIQVTMDTSDISGCERLSILNDELGRCAKNPEVTTNYWFTYILGRIPKNIADFFISLAKFPAVVSNIPLCTRNIHLWERECSEIVGWVPLTADTGLTICSVRYGDHFRYCLQADSTVMTEEELSHLVKVIEQQVEDLCLETVQLSRKISTDITLFEREKEPKETKDTCKNENGDGILSSHNNNNSSNVDGGVTNILSSSNYYFLGKLKDSIGQIRDGIRKIKEE